MVRDARNPPVDQGSLARIDHDSCVAVVGTDRDGHASTCLTLSSRPSVTTPLRVCANSPNEDLGLGVDEPYESGAGVHPDLDVTEAGLVATEAITNLVEADDSTGFHLCIDGVPTPETEADARALFEFLFTATRMVEARGAGCHVHVDTEHGSRFAETIAPIFDCIVELDGRGRHRLSTWDGSDPPWQSL